MAQLAPSPRGGGTIHERRRRCRRNTQARGNRFSLLLSPQPLDRGLRRVRHSADPLPARARRRRLGGRLHAHQAGQAQRRVRRPGGSRYRERLSRRGAGLFRERPAADHPRGSAARAPIRAPGVSRRRRLSADHQMVGDGTFGSGAARPDAPGLSHHAQRQGRPGAHRDSCRGVGGEVRGRARLVAHAVIGDAAVVLDAFIAEVGRQKGAGGANALASLKEDVAAAKKAWLAEWDKQLNSEEMPINQYRVIRDLMRSVDRDNVIITHDSGGPREQLIPFWETSAPGSYMGWGKSTQLGYGLGITMGAKLAAPEKLCVNIMGDASIGMTGMDIETAARNRIAILTIVFNNGVMAAEPDVLQVSTKKYGALTVGGN